MHARVASAVVLTGVLLVRAPLHAEERPSATLDYQADPSCPDEATLRSDVAQRLGFDPFRSAAKASVTARITRGPGGLAADVTYDDAAGRHGERHLTHPSDCAELTATVALTISILIDPRSLTGPARAPSGPAPTDDPTHPSVDPDPPRPTAPTAPVAPISPPRPRPGPRLRLGGGPVFSVGAGPAPVFGAAIFGGVRLPSWSLDLEGRADLPGTVERTRGVELGSSILVASVVPCLHGGRVAGCLLATAGALRGEVIDGGAAQQDVTFYAAVGGRFGLELPLSGAGPEGLAIRPHLDVAAPLTPTTLSVGGASAWSSPPITGALGIDLLGTIP